MKPCPIRFVSFCSTPSAHRTAVFATHLPEKSHAHVRSGCRVLWSDSESFGQERGILRSGEREMSEELLGLTSERGILPSIICGLSSQTQSLPSERGSLGSGHRSLGSERGSLGSERGILTYKSRANPSDAAVYAKPANFEQKPTNNQNQCLN